MFFIKLYLVDYIITFYSVTFVSKLHRLNEKFYLSTRIMLREYVSFYRKLQFKLRDS